MAHKILKFIKLFYELFQHSLEKRKFEMFKIKIVKQSKNHVIPNNIIFFKFTSNKLFFDFFQHCLEKRKFEYIKCFKLKSQSIPIIHVSNTKWYTKF